MPKNIVVCSDGTGNTAIKGRGTNVFKLFEAVDLNTHRRNPALPPQIAFYDDGVGTESFKPLRLLGGAFGWGLARNVKQLYRNISKVYDPGDRIYLFGFSRGAFTVRTLAGMITSCGLVNGTAIAQPDQLARAVNAAYRAYRARYDSTITRWVGRLGSRLNHEAAVGALWKACPMHRDVPMRFIGVWDTVDAVGLPFAAADLFNKYIYQFKFPNRTLHPSIERACHALSIDDDRASFSPVLWEDTSNDPGRIDQVWFAGVHSNVGGGYPKQGMSLVALEWMLYQARDAGLTIQPLDLEMIAGHASVDDKLYDPRAGLGIFYRWKPRNITAYYRSGTPRPRIHVSVFERIAHGTDDYAPGNLPDDFEVVITATGKPAEDRATLCRAEEIAAAVAKAPTPRGEPLLASVAAAVAAGAWSYGLFVLSWLALVAAVFGAVGAVVGAVSSSWLSAPVLSAVAGFVAAWALSKSADRRMERAFASFWHPRQQAMRTALKNARALVAGGAVR
jgi:uncharacterized protein (DUF2235 family)